MIVAFKPIESGADIVNFANALIVFALAQSRSTEVEAQHGKAKTAQRLHGMEHHFVVQSSAKEWMRMAYKRGMSGVISSCVQQRFQASGGTVEK